MKKICTCLFVIFFAFIGTVSAQETPADIAVTQKAPVDLALSYPEIEIAKEWGVIMVREERRNAQLHVRYELTEEKGGLSDWFAAATFKKATAKADPPAKKALERLWSINGIENMAFSTYAILIQWGRAFSWVEIADEVEESMANWKESRSHD